MTIRAFISYTHDSTEHMDRVWDLCVSLYKNGIGLPIDQYELSRTLTGPRATSTREIT